MHGQIWLCIRRSINERLCSRTALYLVTVSGVADTTLYGAVASYFGTCKRWAGGNQLAAGCVAFSHQLK